MHKNPNERIKLPHIKNHPWFSLYKVSFLEVSPEVAIRQSNLITDSMLLEGGEDPFEDFMNKRLKNSHSSGGKSPDDSKGSLNDRDSDLSDMSANEDRHLQTSLSFKKQDRFSDLTKEIANDQLLGLEIIPEEKGVDRCYQSSDFIDLNSTGMKHTGSSGRKTPLGDDPFEEREERGRGSPASIMQFVNFEERERLKIDISTLK